MAAAFFEQFCVQGAWGVIPIHLMELSPGSFRTFVVGTSYQLGNLISSASSTIEATIGERFPLPPKGKTPRYKYGLVICIFMACVYVYVIILTFLGPEKLGHEFGIEHDADLADAAGSESLEAVLRRKEGKEVERDSSEERLQRGSQIPKDLSEVEQKVWAIMSARGVFSRLDEGRNGSLQFLHYVRICCQVRIQMLCSNCLIFVVLNLLSPSKSPWVTACWWAASIRYCMNEKDLPTHATKMDLATSRIHWGMGKIMSMLRHLAILQDIMAFCRWVLVSERSQPPPSPPPSPPQMVRWGGH